MVTFNPGTKAAEFQHLQVTIKTAVLLRHYGKRECEWMLVYISDPCDRTVLGLTPPSANICWDWLQHHS